LLTSTVNSPLGLRQLVEGLELARTILGCTPAGSHVGMDSSLKKSQEKRKTNKIIAYLIDDAI
jgi:hypothetical protein